MLLEMVRCEEMTAEELQAYLSETQDGFPEPLLVWMKAPGPDMNLGINLVKWLTAKSDSHYNS